MRKFFNSIPKVFFAVLCYIFTLGLAIASGFFTFSFYSESQTDLNYWVMGGLAIIIELVKITLSVSYPFMKYREYESEKKVLRYLKICFFLSIMASLYFFMSGGEIDRSPASKMTELIYLYIPTLSIIPLKLTQFITTMSLSILVEAFIIFLPMIAPIMFLEKDYNRKRKYNLDSSIDKIKIILTTIPERFIDKLYRKIVVENNINMVIPEEIKEPKKYENRPKLKLIKSTNYVKLEPQKAVIDTQEPSKPVKEKTPVNNRIVERKKNSEKEKNDLRGYENSMEDQLTFEDIEPKNTGQEKKELDYQKYRKLVVEAINEYSLGNVCPSVNFLVKKTGLTKEVILKNKKDLEREGQTRTEGNKTFILSDSLKGGVKA